MFEFKPPEARDALNLTSNRFIVCWGNQAALLPLVDFLANGGQSRVHATPTFPDPVALKTMQRNLQEPYGDVVIFVTDEKALLPYHMNYRPDLVLFGENSGNITVHKDRGGSLPSMFRCTGTSSPTGRTFVPSSPAMHNMRPSDGRLIDATKDQIGPRVPRHFDVKDTSWRGYSMGATVKEPECPLCEAGLPAYKHGEKPMMTPKFEFKSYNDHAIMTHTSDGEMKLNDGKGREFIKVNAEGEAFVRGEKVAAGQQDIYEMFRSWMQKVAGGLPQDRHTKMHIPLPEAWKADAQGDVMTKECVDQLRKQVNEFGLPVRMFNPGPYEGPVWDAVAGNPCNEIKLEGDNSKNAVTLDAAAPSNTIITKTGHDITNAVRRQETARLINDIDSDPHITDSLRERIIAALKAQLKA